MVAGSWQAPWRRSFARAASGMILPPVVRRQRAGRARLRELPGRGERVPLPEADLAAGADAGPPPAPGQVAGPDDAVGVVRRPGEVEAPRGRGRPVRRPADAALLPAAVP